jgi:hypothetical protein
MVVLIVLLDTGVELVPGSRNPSASGILATAHNASRDCWGSNDCS